MEKTVIVTGGSRGIGASIVQLLAREGYQVILNYYKSEEIAKKIQEESTNKGYCVEIFKADVSKREEVKKLVDFTIQKFGKIDVLINNAGISQTKLFTDITEEDWNTMLDIDLNSVFHMTQEVVPHMIHEKEGCIINISSIWGMCRCILRSALQCSKSRSRCHDKVVSQRTRTIQYKSEQYSTRNY